MKQKNFIENLYSHNWCHVNLELYFISVLKSKSSQTTFLRQGGRLILFGTQQFFRGRKVHQRTQHLEWLEQYFLNKEHLKLKGL